MQTVSIGIKPTYDLTNMSIVSVSDEGVCFVESTQVYQFDGVYATIMNRSRVLRTDKDESNIVEGVIAAVIDAGFCGRLVWKIKLTNHGLSLYNSLNTLADFVPYIQYAQQLCMWTSPAGNYYEGTNQTNLIPDVIFTH